MKNSCEKHDHGIRSGTGPLYGAAFAMAMSLSVLWTSMPFIISNIGGTEEHVGYAWAANMGGYVLCILLAAGMLGHLNPRHVTRTAVAVMLSANSVMLVAIWLALPGQGGNLVLIWTIIGAGTIAGASMSMYWPFLMSWVSADLEGPSLNRRLGTYNGTWSGAAITGPLIAGAIVERSTVAPVAVAVVSLSLCFVLLCLARNRPHVKTVEDMEADNADQANHNDRRLYLKYMARIALFCSWVSLGVSRSQFALLFTSLGYTETQFGMLLTVFGICNFAVLSGAGRVSFWHARPILLPAVQIVLVAAFLLMIFGRSLGMFFIAFVIMGSSFGFAYSSHLYYSASGKKKRALPMAIHEITLSFGVVVGSGVGGYLAGAYGGYVPYWFAVTVIVIGLLAQFVLWAVLRPAAPAFGSNQSG